MAEDRYALGYNQAIEDVLSVLDQYVDWVTRERMSEGLKRLRKNVTGR